MMVINTAENNSIASGSSSEAGERKPQAEERIQDLDSNSLGMEYNDQNKDDQVKPTSFKEHLVFIFIIFIQEDIKDKWETRDC